MNRRSFAILAVVLAACEPEPPPKTPVGPPPGAPPQVAPVANAQVPALVPAAPVGSAAVSAAPGAPAPGPAASAAAQAAAAAAQAAAAAAQAASAAAQAASAAARAASAAAQAVGGVVPEPGVVVPEATATPAPPATAASAAPATLSGTVTTPKGPAANAVVYLEGAPVEPTATMSAKITNKMMKFVPYVVVIPAGGKVVFGNDDPFPHNVNSPDGERFDLGDLAQNEAKSHVFKSPGVYSILCHLHPAMLGYVVVAPSSYYAKADGQGHFAIKNVPPGSYRVTAWAPHDQPSTLPVTVSGADTAVNLEVHR
jgi:plastocyanin